MKIITAQEALKQTKKNNFKHNTFLLGQFQVTRWFKEFENQVRSAIERRETSIERIFNQEIFLARTSPAKTRKI